MEAEGAKAWRTRFIALRFNGPLARRSAAALHSATLTARRSAGALGRRPHHLAAAALAAGLALAPVGGPAVPITAIGAGAVALVAAGAARQPGSRRALLAAAMVCAGAVAGTWRVDAIDRSAERAGPAGTFLSGRATLLEHPRRSQFGSSAAVRMTSGRAAGTLVLARLDGFKPWPDGGEPGSILRMSGSTERPATGASFDWGAYLRRRGIAYELKVESLSSTGARRGGVLGVVDSMRRRAERALGSGLPGAEAALARGMVLGEDEAIDRLERDDFRRAGLSHVLAVSGQNVMLLCALALPLLGWLGAGPRARVAVLVGLIAVYVPLAGAGPSLQRAGVMGAVGLIALAAGRAGSRWYALELAAVVTLGLNPRVSGDTGWQLSFAAVAGILLLATPIRSALKGLPGALAEGIAVTLAATLATAPLIAHDFGSVSLAGVAANVVALPLVAGIMWAGMLQCAVAQLPDALGVVSAAIAALARLDGLLLGLLRAVVRSFADAPGSRVVLPLGSRVAVTLAYALIVAFVAAVRQSARRVEPRTSSAAAAWRRLPSRRRTAAVALLAGLAAAGWRLRRVPRRRHANRPSRS